jgi:hypothetical protein
MLVVKETTSKLLAGIMTPAPMVVCGALIVSSSTFQPERSTSIGLGLNSSTHSAPVLGLGMNSLMSICGAGAAPVTITP